MRASRMPLLARVGSAVAVTALATAGVITATAASATTHKLPTQLSVNHKLIAKAHHLMDSVTGVLSSGKTKLAGETVSLQSRIPGKRFAVIGSATTGTGGSVTFAVAPTRKTQYELTFSGDATHLGSRSSVITLTVPRRLQTQLSIRNKLIALAHHHAEMITGVLKSNRTKLGGKTVILLSRIPGKRFAVASTGTTGTNGSVSFVVTPTKRTQYELIFKGDVMFRPSRSNVITLLKV
ncbi:MAG TPA: hypothetical protein VNF47_04490 [Streptosporangiaceae bacterium]|nr:hypothetical protein [Streptosporangiaceae bacterium]